MGRRRHPKNLPQCAGTVNSLLFFHIYKSASFFSKCFNFKLNTMQIFNLGQKKASSWLQTMDWLPVVSAGTDPMFMYTNRYLFVCLVIYYGNIFL